MAGKKPAKPNPTSLKEKQNQPPGKAVKYFSTMKNQNPFTCPICSRQLFKGIVYELNSNLFCSRRCFPKESQ